MDLPVPKAEGEAGAVEWSRSLTSLFDDNGQFYYKANIYSYNVKH